MKLTRGFAGRGNAERDPRLPPGQYDTGKSWPVLTAEVTPKLDTASWTLRDRRSRGDTDHVVVGRDPRPAEVDLRRGHPLRDQVDQARRCLGGRAMTRSSMRWGVAAGYPRGGVQEHGYTTNLPLEDVTGGKASVAWETTGSRPPWTTVARAAAGSAPVLLEERSGWRGSAPRPRRARLLGTHGYHARGDPWLEQRYQGD